MTQHELVKCPHCESTSIFIHQEDDLCLCGECGEVWEQAAKAQAVPQWISVSERLPDKDYGYFLVTRKHWNEGWPQVCYSFYIKDRDMAKKEHANGYSRRYQGKDSIHFECSRGGFIITHWMPVPTAPEQNK